MYVCVPGGGTPRALARLFFSVSRYQGHGWAAKLPSFSGRRFAVSSFLALRVDGCLLRRIEGGARCVIERRNGISGSKMREPEIQTSVIDYNDV